MKSVLNAFFVLSFVAAGPAAAASKKIKSESEFKKIVVGHKMAMGDNVMTITADGKMSGKLLGKKAVGAWKWSGTKFCRAVKTSEHEWPSACQNVSYEGNQITFANSDGSGTPAVWSK